jgi:hypothetical protein
MQVKKHNRLNHIHTHQGGEMFITKRFPDIPAQPAARKPHLLTLCCSLLVIALLVGQSHQISWAQDVPAQINAASFFVSPSGSDSYNGSANQPFATIQRAIDRSQAGDTIYVRGGVYREVIRVDKSGAAQRPITIAAYPGETPIIDGEYLRPEGKPARWNNEINPPRYFVWDALVRIKGSHIRFTGFELRRSLGRGIVIGNTADNRSQDILVENCSIHNIRNQPVLVNFADKVTVQKCNIYHGSDYAIHDRPTAALNWPAMMITVNARQVLFRQNKVYENWGEGISAGVDSVGVTIEDNLIYNNMGVQIYVHRAHDVLIQRNLLYHTNDANFHRGGNPSGCIALNNEDNFPGSLTVKNVTIRNNITAGCQANIAIWASDRTGLPVTDVVIAHNTLIKAMVNPRRGTAVGLNISPSSNLRNVRIERNIIWQPDQYIAYGASDPQVTYANNIWSRTPPTGMFGPGDQVVDPKLTNPSSALIPGGVQVEWYRPLPSSPALAGKQGAYELFEPTTPVPTSTSTPLPTQGTPMATPPTNTPIPTPTATPTLPASPTATPTPVSTPTTLPPTMPPGACSTYPTNWLSNPSLEQGRDDWKFSTTGQGIFATEGGAFECDKAARVEITKGGSNVQFYQTGIDLEPDTHYRLTFAAYSNTGHDLELFIHKNTGSYANYGLRRARADLTTNWKLFTTEFTTSGFSQPVGDARLRFWMAPYDAAGDVYWIDQIRLEKAVEAQPVTGADPLDGTEPISETPVSPEGATIFGLVQLADGTDEGPTAALGAKLVLNDAATNGDIYSEEIEVDFEGLYEFADLKPGNYLVTVVPSSGYQAPAPTAVVVQEGDTYNLSFLLEKAPQLLFLPFVAR